MLQIQYKDTMKMFSIFADYRPKNTVRKHYYYVIANNKLDAKRVFQNTIPWLKIYEIEECDAQKAQNVVNNPERFILL